MATIGLMLGHLPHARTARNLVAALHAVAPRGTRLVEISSAGLPLHAPYDDMPTPAGAIAFKREISAVDGLLVVMPTHERSLPGALKHALDWASASPSSLAGTPVVIAGAAAPRRGRFVALQHLRTVLSDAGADLMGQPERSLTVSPQSFGPAGEILDAELEAQIHSLLSAAAGFVAHVSRTAGDRPAPATPGLGLSTAESRRPMRALEGLSARGDRGPSSVVDLEPVPFVASASTADPLLETGDPAVGGVSTETATGFPTGPR